jgi:hypothetical protein
MSFPSAFANIPDLPHGDILIAHVRGADLIWRKARVA